jgi:hypothetical protein
MKVSTKTATFWEVWESKNEHAYNVMSRPPKHGGSGEDFRNKEEAEEYGREAGLRWVKKIVYAYDDEGIYGESAPCSELFYRVKPSVVEAHARCCRCGQEETFKNGVLAYDWKFKHEVMHNFLISSAALQPVLPLSQCVETWEIDLAEPGKTFPLRKSVSTAAGFRLVPIIDEPELEPSTAVMSDGEDED